MSLPGFALATGAEVTVSFTVTNTASSPTLNVNGTGAKPIQYRNAAISAGYLAANRTYRFVYDGSSYELVGDVDTNTTYTAATAAPKNLAEAAAVGTSKNYAREDHVHKLPASVAKLSTKRTIDGVQFDGSADLSRYALCSTAGAAVAKTVTVSNFLLKVGAVVVLKFAYTNTAKSPTLNVSGTGPKGIFFGGAAIGAGAVIAGRTYTLVYDGVGWELVGDLYAQQVSDLIAELDFLRKLKIGAPRYHCSTTLPDRHAWINGDFIAFEDAPEFGEKYEAGGFDGMVMPWDADEKYQAAHLGQFRPDSANPTGLFLPVDGGQFFRNWGPDQSERPSGSWQGDALQGHWHSITDDDGRKFAGYTDGGNGPGWGAGYGETQVQARAIISADGYGLPRVAIETRPVNISQPVILNMLAGQIQRQHVRPILLRHQNSARLGGGFVLQQLQLKVAALPLRNNQREDCF